MGVPYMGVGWLAMIEEPYKAGMSHSLELLHTN